MTERSRPHDWACPEVLEDPLLTVTVSVPHPMLRVVVRAVGDIDLMSGPDFSDALTEGVDALGTRDTGLLPDDDPPPTPTVVCDLDGVTFCGATAASALVEGAAYARARGVRLVVTAARDRVRRALVLAGLVDAAGTSTVLTCPPERLGASGSAGR